MRQLLLWGPVLLVACSPLPDDGDAPLPADTGLDEADAFDGAVLDGGYDGGRDVASDVPRDVARDAGYACSPAEPGLEPPACPDRFLACRIAPDGSTSCGDVLNTHQPGDECVVDSCDRNMQCLRPGVSGLLTCWHFCYLEDEDPDPDCNCAALTGMLNPDDLEIALPPGIGLCTTR